MPDGPSLRKSPRCRHCLQPRKGHPRSGCPSTSRVASEDITEGPHSGDASHLQSVDGQVNRNTECRPQRASAPPLLPQPTLHTVTTGSAEIVAVAGPSCSGVYDDEKTVLRRRIERWRHGIPADATASAPNTPRPKHEELPETSSATAPLVRQPKPLPHTMSMEERYNFLEKLKQSTKRTAQVFIMEKSEAQPALDGAKKQGFHGGACIPAQGQDAFLVLGMDKEAVDTLLETVRSEHGSPVKHGVAGAVVGAVAMWAGLAYS
jgi:hypothetical protein